MKMNRSLGLSAEIQKQLKDNRLGMLNSIYPTEFDYKEPVKRRKRVFTTLNTLQTMVVTATMQDKTLKNSVNIHYLSHQKERDLEEQYLKKQIRKAKKEAKLKAPKVGRPKLYKEQLPKSKQENLSLNTAAYSKARTRVPLELIEDLFRQSIISESKNNYSHWFGHRVFIGDGTYVQMQDTNELREKYVVKHNGIESEGYPQGLIETITERGTGQIFSYALSNRHTGELELFYEMIEKLPKNSILLVDDLYNTYEIFAKLERQNIKMVVPGKRIRNYTVIKKINEDDEIVSIKKPCNRPGWLPDNAIDLPEEIILRRIQCISSDGKPYILYTSVLDEKIKKDEIVNLYLSRWDIEVSIREIKTIMDINILRSKSELMIKKELAVSLAAYNLIRKLIYNGIKDMPFSPKRDFFQELYTLNKDVLVDKKGRVYNKWSTGRKRTK
jgi:Transposase DDE domain